MAEAFEKVFRSGVQELDAGDVVCVDARGMATLTVITAAGATATVSRIDEWEREAVVDDHTTGTQNQFTVAASTRTVTPVDWPFYLVSVAGGSCRVAVG
jgi:hypothetical protein